MKRRYLVRNFTTVPFILRSEYEFDSIVDAREFARALLLVVRKHEVEGEIKALSVDEDEYEVKL